MKELFFAFALTSVLFSCKKETSNPPKTDPTNPSGSAVVTSIDCASIQLTGLLKKGEVANSVSFELFYKGGNGETFSSQSINSTGVIGLTAKLSSGVLENGVGSVIYSVTGTPTSSGPANFAIALGGENCTVTVNVEDVSQSSGINFTSNGSPVGVFQNNVLDVDGNTYKTVKIGTQVWMAENLKTSKYSDGSTIPKITDDTEWQNNTTGAWAYFNNDATNNVKYGKLYNWYAVSKTSNGNKNVCPTGWHVPTDIEWMVLKGYLGGHFIAGGKLKEVGTTSWYSPNKDATNVSLFTGLPCGSRSKLGFYGGIGSDGFWWSSSENSTSDAWFSNLYYDGGDASWDYSDKGYGFSVRCLRD
jgi:uncharacterized protein (TIGR02145 family)